MRNSIKVNKVEKLLKPGETIKAALNRYQKARANMKRIGHNTSKVDMKIDALKEALEIKKIALELQQDRNRTKETSSKYISYNKISKLPMRGGKMSPK